MEKFTTNLLSIMYSDLQKIAADSDSDLQQVEESIVSVESSMRKLKEFIANYKFKDINEEIKFFKEIKPQFLKEHIYFIELFYVESEKPIGSTAQEKRHYEMAQERIVNFVNKNKYLYNYYRTGKTDFDHVYFKREMETLPLLPEYILDLDPRFSSPYSFKLAKLQAYEQLNSYLRFALQNGDQITKPDEKERKRNTTWTDSKAALIELAYALHSRGSVNYGKTDMKNLISNLEGFFNISLGNFYRVYMDMLIRKKSRTPYIDNLKDDLLKRMDDSDY